MPISIQQLIASKVTLEDIDLYNNVYQDYMKSKRRLDNLKEKIELHITQIDLLYDRTDAPLSKQKYRLSEVKEDVSSILHRQRNNNRGSMGNLIPMSFNQPEFVPIERKGRSSLIPFRLSIGSVNNNPMSEKASRRSDLLKDFENLNRESALFKNSNLDFAQMLDFF